MCCCRRVQEDPHGPVGTESGADVRMADREVHDRIAEVKSLDFRRLTGFCVRVDTVE